MRSEVSAKMQRNICIQQTRVGSSAATTAQLQEQTAMHSQTMGALLLAKGQAKYLEIEHGNTRHYKYCSASERLALIDENT